MKKILFSLLFLHLLLSCGSDSEDPETDRDTTPPSISILGVQETIDTPTTINFTIADAASTISTVVLLNGEQVLSTTQKSFSYELDPYELPSGSATLTITSTDDQGNENTETITFNLQKLLFRGNGSFSSSTVDSYLAINLEETGELIAFRKIETEEDLTFYAPDDFEIQDLIVTNYGLPVNEPYLLSTARSTGSVQPGTDLFFTFEQADLLGLDLQSEGQNGQLQLSVTDVPSGYQLSLFARDYFSGGGGSTDFSINYNTQNTEDIFVYAQPVSSDPIAGYRYFILEDYVDQTISFNDFAVLESDQAVNLPLPDDTERFGVTLAGYMDADESYRNGDYRLLYSHSADVSSSEKAYDIPVLEQYPQLEQWLTINLNDGGKIISTFKGTSEIEIPNFSATRQSNTVSTSGDYDMLRFIFKLEMPLSDPPGSVSSFQHWFQDFPSNSAPIPFETLEIPQEIVEGLVQRGFDISYDDPNAELTISLTKYEQQQEYPQGPFYVPLRNEAGDATTLVFPIN